MLGFLNEVSLPHFYSKNEVRTLFDDFGEYYKKARSLGVRDVKILSSFHNHEFAPSYRFDNWLRDPYADDDLKTLLKSTFGTTPYIDDILSTYETQNSSVLEMKVDDTTVIGLGLASDYIFNTLAFSYRNNGWDLATYQISIKQTKEENNIIVEYNESAQSKNISSIAHCDLYVDFINEQSLLGIESGKELWIKKEDIFPNLTFCNNVKHQLGKYSVETLGFSMIIKRLFELQDKAINFDGNPIKPGDFSSKTTKESDSRLNRLSKELTFLSPDGSEKLFSWHMRFTPGAGRLYFIPDEQNNNILIGSIGLKIV